jgi:diketogulonate reductase-like aldo/keto reductase
MSERTISINRRRLLQLLAAATPGFAAMSLMPVRVIAGGGIHSRPIPKTGERLPVIGMGTSRTFEAEGNEQLMNQLREVTQIFFDLGGTLIDSSPMYGSAQQVIGQLLTQIRNSGKLFAATKVWTEGREEGIDQMEASRRLWGIKRFDLMQIHNLVDWQTHLETLKQMKAGGQLRYIGITTSHGRFHSELAGILNREPFDFVQLTYNIGNHNAEPLLSIARDKGIAVIVNRPYQRGDLFRHVKGKPLPPMAKDIDCSSWGQWFLKYVVSHPAINCVIPATTKVKHMRDNMQGGIGRMPDKKQRAEMLRYFESL